jgi:hypothetical protein
MKGAIALLVCLFCLSLPAAALEGAPKPIKKFTPQQVDHILVLDRSKTRDEETRRLSSRDSRHVAASRR